KFLYTEFTLTQSSIHTHNHAKHPRAKQTSEDTHMHPTKHTLTHGNPSHTHITPTQIAKQPRDHTVHTKTGRTDQNTRTTPTEHNHTITDTHTHTHIHTHTLKHQKRD